VSPKLLPWGCCTLAGAPQQSTLVCTQGPGRAAATQQDKTRFIPSSSEADEFSFPLFLSVIHLQVAYTSSENWGLFLFFSSQRFMASAFLAMDDHCGAGVRQSRVLSLLQTLQLLWKRIFALTQPYVLRHLLLGPTYTAQAAWPKLPDPQPLSASPEGATAAEVSQKSHCLALRSWALSGDVTKPAASASSASPPDHTVTPQTATLEFHKGDFSQC